MKDFLLYIAKKLVDQPERVEVREAQGQDGLVFELRVAPEDMGKVIGKQGRTVQALRTLLAAAAPAGKRVVLDLPER